MLTRYADWQTRLHTFLNEHLTSVFQYGTLDCCLFAIDGVRATTGTDLAAEFRGTYSSRKHAAAIIRRRTGTHSLPQFVSQVFAEHGLPTVTASCAQRGDLVLVTRGGGHSLGLIGLSGQDIVAIAKCGYLRFPLERARCAWRV